MRNAGSICVSLSARRDVHDLKLGGQAAGGSLSFMELDMPAMRSAAIGVSSEVISGILNSVRPDCGGSMGEPGREFECRGECQRDWRPLWERLLSAGFHRQESDHTELIE
jgi:hypothetical protein